MIALSTKYLLPLPHHAAGAELSVILSPQRIRDFINDGELAISLLLLSVRVEYVLSEKIKEEFELSDPQFDRLGLDRETLGWYFSKCNELNLIPDEYKEAVSKLKDERNSLVHDKGHYEKIQRDTHKNKEIKEISDQVLEFVKSEL